MMMNDLKPCPFCAGKARLELHKFHELGNTYGVKCELCGAQCAQFYNTEQDAIRAWNRRKTPHESRKKMPCPKCGRKRLSVWCSCDNDGKPIETITCDKCKIASAWSHTTIGAIRDWNRMVKEWKE